MVSLVAGWCGLRWVRKKASKAAPEGRDARFSMYTWTSRTGHKSSLWGYLWKTTGFGLQVGLDCLRKSVILNRARLSVNCKLLTLNLWMVLARYPDKIVRRAEVFQQARWKSKSTLLSDARYLIRRVVSHMV